MQACEPEGSTVTGTQSNLIEGPSVCKDISRKQLPQPPQSPTCSSDRAALPVKGTSLLHIAAAMGPKDLGERQAAVLTL